MPIFRFSSIVIFSVESLVFFLEYNQTVYLGLLKKKLRENVTILTTTIL